MAAGHVSENTSIFCFLITFLTVRLIAELHSGPKGRRAEPHNYRARIEIEKTMRLSFHGHRGKRHGSRARALYIHTYVRTYVRTKLPKMAAILQEKLDLGRPLTGLILTIPL